LLLIESIALALLGPASTGILIAGKAWPNSTFSKVLFYFLVLFLGWASFELHLISIT